MCGRYFIDWKIQELLEDRSDAEVRGGLAQREISPGMQAPAWIRGEAGLRIVPMTWGFGNGRGGLVINCRVESMRERPMFSPLADTQRCAMPASGYFEWRRSDRQKYAIALDGCNPIYLAGLYRRGERGTEFVVLTQPPVDGIRSIHNRMPVILRNADAMQAWLDGRDPDAPGGKVDIRSVGDEQLRMPFDDL